MPPGILGRLEVFVAEYAAQFIDGKAVLLPRVVGTDAATVSLVLEPEPHGGMKSLADDMMAVGWPVGMRLRLIVVFEDIELLRVLEKVVALVCHRVVADQADVAPPSWLGGELDARLDEPESLLEVARLESVVAGNRPVRDSADPDEEVSLAVRSTVFLRLTCLEFRMAPVPTVARLPACFVDRLAIEFIAEHDPPLNVCRRSRWGHIGLLGERFCQRHEQHGDE